MNRAAALAGAAALIAGMAVSVRGQEVSSPGVMPELRADVLFGRQSAAQIGAGVQIPFGYYVRLGLDGAVGVRLGEGGGSRSRADARADLLTRFLLDPFRQSRYGLSLGGGIGVRAEPGDHVRPVLLAAVDVEGARWSSGWVPALQVGLGGGARAGIMLRRGTLRAR
ncbi:MAG: hypothetical protein M3Z10_08630 [Gemmatimonadota bacterium]|nr:hypothetical protein [Gemmatimonadota bacterium]